MILSAIWAMTRNRVIGKDGDLPWRLPDDQRFFRRTTLGKPVIMGRKTFDEIGRPLPKRRNIVLSRRGLEAEGVEVVTDLDAALDRAKSEAPEEAFIIGGAEIYALAWPRLDRLYMTLIDAELEGDTWFPDFELAQWREVKRTEHPADERHAWPFSIHVMERV
ncbi:MAG: dihydrofolate reductase [Gammaproteobacteria bacterium]|nr:dihydrofolate reductase [Gammaproteobacteria bacterium]